MSDKTRLDYGQAPACWEERSEPIVRFWIGERWMLLPFFSFLGGAYLPEKESMALNFPRGTVLITGPKAGEFCSAFCNHKGTLLKANGKDITSVEWHVDK